MIYRGSWSHRTLARLTFMTRFLQQPERVVAKQIDKCKKRFRTRAFLSNVFLPCYPLLLHCRGFRVVVVVWPQALAEELDSKISALADEMYEEGIDAATLARIVKDKDAAEARSAKLYAEVRASCRRACFSCLGILTG